MKIESDQQMASSSSSSSSSCKRKASVISDGQKRLRVEPTTQDVLTVKDVCDLIQYVTLRRSHSVKKPSWFSVSDDVRLARVNVMILDGLTQSHFYRYFSHFRHLRNKYSSRWTLAPSSCDPVTSDLLSSKVTVETQTPLPAALMWHPVIRRFGSSAAGLSHFLLTEQEMIKHNFPVKGGRGCEAFVCSKSGGHVTDSSPLFGLDCEMCLTRVGLEVTRVALVDADGRCVLDELVKPPNPIINYCTSAKESKVLEKTDAESLLQTPPQQIQLRAMKIESDQQMASSSSSSSSSCKRKASVISDGQKRLRVEPTTQDVLTVKDVCDLIQYVTLRRSHSVKKPSWFSVSDDVRLARVNVMILDGLTQSHFYRYFSHFRHLRNKYSSRWTLAPSSCDPVTSDLLSSKVTVETQTPLPAALMWHPVIRRFGSSAAGLSHFLLTEQEMIKHNFPVKGGRGCEAFVCSKSGGHVTDSSPLFGLDCEMCLTRVGLEVTRVALVDADGRCVLDELVKPPNPIINYCTRFSGITRALLAPVSTCLSEVQSKLLQLLPRDAVLTGHSLDGDLRALHMIHPHVIDTSLLYRQDFGRRFKLKHLAQVILNREIQSEDRRGHDPCEDALAALHLAQYFIRKGPRKVLEDHLEELWDIPETDGSDTEMSSDRGSSLSNHSALRFGHALYGSGQSAVFLGGAVATNCSVSNQQSRRQQCSSDREVVCVFRRLVQSYSLSVLRFSSFMNTLNQATATGRQRHLQQVCERLRQMCVLYVGPLPADITERDVHTLMKRCGRLRTLRLLQLTHGVHAEVMFEHLEGAQLALDHLNGQQISDCTIKVRRPVHELSLDLDECVCERQNDRLNSHMIYVCNLSTKPNRHDDLLQTFRQFGPVQRVSGAAEHSGKRQRHVFIKFESADSAQAAVGVALQIGSRKLSVCHALTPPHMTSWMHTHPVTTETSLETPEQGEECDVSCDLQEPMLARQMEKMDRRVGKVFRALESNCLSIVILPGERSGGIDLPGLCFIDIKQT